MLEKNFEQIIIEQALFKKGDRILIGVSGGPDSTCLLHLLASLQDLWKFHLVAAHLDHGLRGKQSNEDARWVKVLCQRLKIPCEIRHARVKKTEGCSLEESGRNSRHKFFLDLCNKLRIHKVALAHTADDQVETVLFFLLRGTGKKGLSGMSALAPLAQGSRVELVRPLLGFWKKEILQDLAQKKISFRRDPTNHSNDFARNRIRNRLIAHLKTYNPGIKEHLLRLSRIFLEEDRMLQDMAAKWLERKMRSWDTGTAIPSKDFRKLERPLQVRVLQRMMHCGGFSQKKIGYSHFDGMLSLNNGKTMLPGGIVFRQQAGELVLEKEQLRAKSGRSCTLMMPGRTVWDKGNKIFSTFIRKKTNDPLLKNIAMERELFDADKLQLPLVIRTCKPGDRMKPFGFKGHIKIHDLFIDRKVPQYMRGRYPIVAERKGEILWVVGLRRSEKGRITSTTKKIIEVRAAGR